MRSIFTSLLVFITISSMAQSAAQWAWGYANADAPGTINPDYLHQAVAAHKNKALWCNILNKKYVANEQYGDYRFSEYDTSGSLLNSMIVTGKLSVRSASPDKDGNWYVMAKFEDTLQFPSGLSFTKALEGSGICMFRLNASDLSLQWFKPIGGDFFTTSDCFTIGAGELFFPVDSSDVTRICKMDLASGERTTLWEQTGGGWSTSIKVDTKKNVYLVGTCAFNGINFNGHQTTLPSGFQYPQYIVRYKADGTYDWSRFMQDGTCFNREFSLADDNTIYYTGPLNDTLSLGASAQLHTPASFSSFMVAQMDSTGHFNWARQLSDTSMAEVHLTPSKHAVTGPDNSVILFSSATRYADWGNGVITATAQGYYSGDVVCYDKNGIAQWAEEVRGNYVVPQQIAGSGNSIWVTGNIFDSTALRLDQISVSLPSGPFAYYPWIARMNIGQAATSAGTVGKISSLKLVPDPAHDYFMITGSANSSERISILIVNSMGQKVKQATVCMNEPVSLSGLPSGMYFTELTIGNKRTVEKLLVQ